MQFKKWDLTKGSLTINTVEIVGFQDGDLIAAEYANDRHTAHMSADNYGRLSQNPNRNGSVAIGLSGNSPALTTIQAFIDAGEPLTIAYKDFTAVNSFVLAIDCGIQKEPAFTRAMAIADIVFPFVTTKLEYKHSSPLPAE
jgi:hypothetical protein